LFAPKGAEFEANGEALGAEADCAGPSMGTIEASGLAV